MTWTPIERADGFETNALVLLDLREVDDFEVLSRATSTAPSQASEGSRPADGVTQGSTKALALANARAGLSAIPVGSTAYALSMDESGARLCRDNRVYTGKIQLLKNPILVCSRSNETLRIHARIDQKIVFDAKPKYVWKTD